MGVHKLEDMYSVAIAIVYVCVAGCFFVIQNLWVSFSSLPTRNVQCRLLHQYMYVGLCVSHLLNLASVGVHNHLDG